MSPNLAHVREAIQQLLMRRHPERLCIVDLERHQSAYQSSFPLDEIHVVFGDGSSLDLIFKDLNRQSLSENVRQVKPEFLHDPLREIETYRSLLAEQDLGTAIFYGSVVDSSVERYWLFLEKVLGNELYKVGEFSMWECAARWLAGMHLHFATQAPLALSRAGHWLKYDAEYYRLWMRRTLNLYEGTTAAQFVKDRGRITRLAMNYERVVERLAALPVTFIHGEFYASNVLVGRDGEDLRVCPIDWEMAGVGSGLVDLAALISGDWTDEEKTALALAYHATLVERSTGVPPPELFLKALDDCRLHLAVQWLGWSGNWLPPVDHRQDWLGEAIRLAEKVGCL